jgi:hypothetical protein
VSRQRRFTDSAANVDGSGVYIQSQAAGSRVSGTIVARRRVRYLRRSPRGSGRVAPFDDEL